MVEEAVMCDRIQRRLPRQVVVSRRKKKVGEASGRKLCSYTRSLDQHRTAASESSAERIVGGLSGLGVSAEQWTSDGSHSVSASKTRSVDQV